MKLKRCARTTRTLEEKVFRCALEGDGAAVNEILESMTATDLERLESAAQDVVDRAAVIADEKKRQARKQAWS